MFGQDNRTDMDKALDALGKKGVDQGMGSIVLVIAGLFLLYAISRKK